PGCASSCVLAFCYSDPCSDSLQLSKRSQLAFPKGDSEQMACPQGSPLAQFDSFAFSCFQLLSLALLDLGLVQIKVELFGESRRYRRTEETGCDVVGTHFLPEGFFHRGPRGRWGGTTRGGRLFRFCR